MKADTMPELEVEATPAEIDFADGMNQPSFDLALAPRESVFGELQQILSSLVPGFEDWEKATSDVRQSSSLLKTRSYSQLMVERVKWQMSVPTVSTVPEYRKTMYAHTKLQMRRLQMRMKTTKSETSSLHVSAQQTLPSRVCVELSQLTVDGAPDPSNYSPSPGQRSRGGDHGTRGFKQRSTTQAIPRDLAASAHERKLLV